MPSSFPGSIDTLVSPTGSDMMNDPTKLHSARHSDANNAIIAIETALGARMVNVGLNVKSFGALGNGVADDTSAINSAITAANGSASDPSGGIIYFPAGTYLINSTITVPTKTILRGAGRGGTLIKAGGSFPTSNPMFNLGGSAIAFGCRLEDMQIDCNSVTSSSGVYSNRINEESGLHRVLIKNFMAYGVQVENTGASMAQNFSLLDVECFASATAPGSVVGTSIQLGGALNYGIDRHTFAVVGAGSIAGAIGLRLDGAPGLYSRIHVEGCTTGILIGSIQATAGVHIAGVTGGVGMTDVVKISSAIGSQNIVITGLTKGSAATNGINDQMGAFTSTATQVGIYSVGNGSGTQIPVYTDDRAITPRMGNGLTVNAAALTVNNTLQCNGATNNIGGALRHTGTGLGFYNNATTTRLSVTGSRGGNAALQSLLTQLNTLGLITDSTSA